MIRKEIGSIFPYWGDNKKDFYCNDNFYFDDWDTFSLGREALLYIANKYKNSGSKVLLPAYTCQTVIDPFVQEGWKCVFYGISKDLRIQEESILPLLSGEKPTLMVAHPFYGQGFTNREKEILKIAHNSEIIVVIDITQSIFLKPEIDTADYYVASLRKWFPIPDGGMIFPKQGVATYRELEENIEFVNKQRDAMSLRAKYFVSGDQELKQISIKLNKEAVKSISDNKLVLHKLSGFSRKILLCEDIEENQNERFRNYAFLLEALSNNNGLLIVNPRIEDLKSAPLYFPVYVSEREKLQKKLAEKGIYAPVLWPVTTKDVLINETIEYIYNNILLIPIDQRYSIDDMERIVKTINE